MSTGIYDGYDLLIEEHDAETYYGYIKNQGGLLQWKDHLDPYRVWYTPVLDEDGQRLSRPDKSADRKPAQVFHNPRKVGVVRAEFFREIPMELVFVPEEKRTVISPASHELLTKTMQEAGRFANYYNNYAKQTVIVFRSIILGNLADYVKSLREKSNE